MINELSHNCHPNPLVSVVIPTFNHEKYIRQAVLSALAQRTNFPYEIVIGEDDSPDLTRQICLDLQKEHSDKIRLILNERRDVIYFKGRPSGAYNFITLVQAARGKYISYLEGDDYYSDPEKLQKQIDVFQHNHDTRIVCTSVEKMEETSGKKNIAQFKEGVYSIRDFADRKIVPFACTLMWINDKSVLFPDWYKLCPIGDFALILLLLKDGGHLYALNDCTTVYRIHKRSYYSSLNERHQVQLIHDTLNVIQLHLPELSNKLNHYNVFKAKLEYRLFNADTADHKVKAALVHFRKYVKGSALTIQLVKRIIFLPAIIINSIVKRKIT